MSENIPHSLGGFRGAFESEHGRKPTEQEIWNAAIRSWRDLTRQKSDAVKEQVVEELLISCRCFDDVAQRLCADKGKCSRIEALGITKKGEQ